MFDKVLIQKRISFFYFYKWFTIKNYYLVCFNNYTYDEVIWLLTTKIKYYSDYAKNKTT